MKNLLISAKSLKLGALALGLIFSGAAIYADTIPGVTQDQQNKVDALLSQIGTIAKVIDEQVIPTLEGIVTKRDVGFIEGLQLANAGLSIVPASVSAVSEVIDLAKANPNAKVLIKANLKKTFEAVRFASLVKRLDNLVNAMPSGFVKDSLKGNVLPNLNKIPDLIATLL